MRVPIYQIDAFAARRFAGNPAAVVLLSAFEDVPLQQIALENNLSETAFLVRDGRHWRLRWFTPATEVPLCGHATLASAWVVTHRLDPACDPIVFQTTSGPLTVRRDGERFAMDFPARAPRAAARPAGLDGALGTRAREVLHDGFNYLAMLDSAEAVRRLRPDFSAIAGLDAGGVIITAAGDLGYDCVSRYFAPAKGIDEDPVTGGAHCALAPLWAERLGRREIRAFQASRRGGEIVCRVLGDRVELEGECAFYMEGQVELSEWRAGGAPAPGAGGSPRSSHATSRDGGSRWRRSRTRRRSGRSYREWPTPRERSRSISRETCGSTSAGTWGRSRTSATANGSSGRAIWRRRRSFAASTACMR